MKTKKQWDESGKSFTEFCGSGEEIDYKIYEYFLGVVFPAFQHEGYFLVGEPYSYNELKEVTYMCFGRIGNIYRYEGLCSKEELQRRTA